MSLISSCSWICPIHSSQVLSQEWRCSWSSADRQLLQLHLSDQQFYRQGAPYIRGLTVTQIWFRFMMTSWHSTTFHITGTLWRFPPVMVHSPYKESVMRSFDVLLPGTIFWTNSRYAGDFRCMMLMWCYSYVFLAARNVVGTPIIL